MDIYKFEVILDEIFGKENVKPHAKGFRVIVEYGSMPYCIVIRLENGKFEMDRDAIDQDEEDYEEAYKKAYKILIKNKDRFDGSLEI